MAGSLSQVLASIPGLAGFEAARQNIADRQAQDIGMAQQGLTLAGILRQQQERDAVTRALQGAGGNPSSAIPALMQAGPAGIDAAGKLSTIAENQAQAKVRDVAATEAARKAAFYAPENIAKFSDPNADGTPGAVNMDKFLQAAATNGIVNPEVYANHVAQQQQKKADAEQRLTQAREKIAADIELARQRGADQRQLREMILAGQKELQTIIASNRPEPMVPVKQADGRVVYMPRSQAAGQEVGGRTTDVNLGKSVQQLGTAFEKAGLPTMTAVISEAQKVTPELAAFITGPKSVLPDLAVPPEARAARQAVSKLFNITLKDRSGAAVTYQELERLKKEFGQGVFKTPEQLMNAISKAREIVDAHYNGIAAGFGKPALDAYNANVEAIGGAPFVPGAPPVAAPSATPASSGGWSIKRKP